jgi:hypothetical protein
MLESAVRLPPRPWEDVPAPLAAALATDVEPAGEEIVAAIRAGVAAYGRPLEGEFGRGLRDGVAAALRQFLDLIAGEATGPLDRRLYHELGRFEFREGRTLESLLAAYRLGARVAWRRAAAGARAAGHDAETLALLAEAIFAYIDELSADSVEGYAEARSALEGERQRRRRELIGLLLREPPPEAGDLDAAAEAAAWTLPRFAAALACDKADLGRFAGRLPPDALVSVLDGTGCALLPDPEGPGRGAQLRQAIGPHRAALGPSGPVAALAASWRLAHETLRAAGVGAIGGQGLIRADEHLGELLVFEQRGLVQRIAARRLAPLDELTQGARRRLEQTALVYLSRQGNAAATARALNLHPQTVRYRLARLRELLGEALDDPGARFELEASLRMRAWTAPGD